MSLINTVNLTFAYDGSYDNIFENTSFQIDTDWKLGFTGRNGRGKTTFLNLLRGKHNYSGKISASVEFDYFPFIVEDKTQNTIDIVDAVYSGYEPWELSRELSLLQVDDEVLYRSFDTLSNGEQTKVMLATLFLKPNNFLLIDEPTNHLDTGARAIVSDYLKSKKGFILVSHDRIFLDNCIDHILSINKQNIEIQKGNFSSWMQNKELQDNFEQAENEKLLKDIRRLDEASKRTAKWSDRIEESKIGNHESDRGAIGHKSAKMMKRSKAIAKRQENAAEDKSKLLKNIEKAERLSLSPVEFHSNRLVTLDEICIYYGTKIVCDPISFTINRGDRLALSGKNGSGKSSIIKLILGEDIKFKGNLAVGSNLKISYVSQDTSHLHGALCEFAINNEIDDSLFKTILRKLDFSRVQFEKNIEDFSNGQKKKVLIAKSLCQQAHLYIWDEPLNFIDVLSRIQIENLVLEYKPTMLFVEHDSAFCENVSTAIVQISDVIKAR